MLNKLYEIPSVEFDFQKYEFAVAYLINCSQKCKTCTWGREDTRH